MKENKSFWEKIIKNYSIILRSNENLEEKKILKFNYLKLIIFSIFAIFSFMSISMYITKYALRWWLNPAYIEEKNSIEIKKLTRLINNLEKELEDQNEFISILQMNIKTGIPDNKKTKDYYNSKNNINTAVVTSDKPHTNHQLKIRINTDNPLPLGSFFTPADGMLSSKFDRNKKHFGVDIVSKENEPIKSIDDGIVVEASWSLEYGHVIIIQHKNNLISVYKHNSALMKKQGNYVKKGEIIAIIGNSGELSSAPHLHFEMWHNEVPLNPENYITF